MKYDKMVECSLERSKQKVETAKREIQEMLESKEKITPATADSAECRSGRKQ